MTATTGIVGSGAVGRALAAHIVASGQDVVLCNSRGPATLERLVEELGPRATALETSAVAAADLVVFAIPWPAVVPLLEELPPWHGRILVDATAPSSTTSATPRSTWGACRPAVPCSSPVVRWPAGTSGSPMMLSLNRTIWTCSLTLKRSIDAFWSK
jgi:2-polyprenyl-6-methoxyphenol hydroxylase-like FAD-dependent oxidoreductase